MISPFKPFCPIAVIATTPQSIKTLHPLCQQIGATLHVPGHQTGLKNSQVYQGSLKDYLTSIWSQNKVFIFGLATGAVIRLISHLLNDKSSDPAILVIDPTGKFVISLCSGHQGRADHLTQLIAHQLNTIPIITGATNNLYLPGIDVLGSPFGWRKGEGNWTAVSSLIARGETVQVIQEVGSTLWQAHLPPNHPFYFGFSESNKAIKFPGQIWISATKRQFSSDLNSSKVQWHPRILWAGIGCVRGTSESLIEKAIHEVFKQYNLAIDAIAGIATIDVKDDEIGLVQYCQKRQLPLKTFPADILIKIEVPNPSTIVKQEVGTPSVAEASAIAAADSSLNSLLVSKQIIQSENEGAVTIAVAQSSIEYTGRIGKLYLIGTGPGSLAQITPAAKIAITQADVIIGYSLYLDLIKPLQRPGQVIEALPITQEKQRATRAIELAEWGLTVAVVSSGDCGIYGMAGLVLEELRKINWDGNIPQVEVFPGITSLQASASRVGAPLMHDFCAISLSDLLTPWKVIKKRLVAAAKADFVTAIYNPRSPTRTKQIIYVQEVFLKYRNSQTPVALVRSAYRPDEKITLTSLGEMLNFTIDMLTTVIIGNSSTYNHKGWMITPRGYD
ncbi:bifunctional cobalamin (vitamin B12) biosynthesis/precorrin-3B C17-methyltransferase [cyanobacterium endosymbiont of Rhopalodia gibberula]|uniref:precorrin-3B C(17)-methyltransferase n=1 Tax=cyanobacterium endosymbiont of Rhopalodia gibberula TaxID=1763363 RepID=UPI000DC6E5AC|nr:precorrin-3B C(17)-methyltransferase [cyanobacterium endosymbiont of Rhopalodia gibberula]BBA78849.1 bifunctional cobalamin (vitamin B12) biosynthesis/precorrin-3B C17-methyltransferase [cyanobacterium endosymbiont of Rhopalodia gibberula]